jgi:hypothetical protein
VPWGKKPLRKVNTNTKEFVRKTNTKYWITNSYRKCKEIYKIYWKATCFKRILYDLPIAPHCQAHLRKQFHYVTLRSTKPRNDKPKPTTGRTQGAALKSKNEDIRNDRYSFQKKKKRERNDRYNVYLWKI